MRPALSPPPSPSQGESWAQAPAPLPDVPAAAPLARAELSEEEKLRRRAEKFGLPLDDPNKRGAAAGEHHEASRSAGRSTGGRRDGSVVDKGREHGHHRDRDADKGRHADGADAGHQTHRPDVIDDTAPRARTGGGPLASSNGPSDTREADAIYCGANTIDFVRGDFGTFDGNKIHARIVCAVPDMAQTALSNSSQLQGAIAVVKRGACTFVEKALRVQEAGALAMVAVNSADVLLRPADSQKTGGGVSIPVVGVRSSDFATLAIACEREQPASLTFGVPLEQSMSSSDERKGPAQAHAHHERTPPESSAAAAAAAAAAARTDARDGNGARKSEAGVREDKDAEKRSLGAAGAAKVGQKVGEGEAKTLTPNTKSLQQYIGAKHVGDILVQWGVISQEQVCVCTCVRACVCVC